MKTLVQLLIEAGITPNMFTSQVKWLAQDKRDKYVFAFTSHPVRGDGEVSYKNKDVILADIGNSDNNCISMPELASDWETPLSWEDFKTAYDKMVDDTWPKSYEEVKDPQAPAIQVFVDSAANESLALHSLDSLLEDEKYYEEEINKLRQKQLLVRDEVNKRLDKYNMFISKKY